jgi:hypothetical protein
MEMNKPMSLYLLNGQVEVFSKTSTNEVYRNISFNNAETWNDWKTMPFTSTITPCICSTPDSRVRFAVNSPPLLPFNPVRIYTLFISDKFGYEWSNGQTIGEGIFTSNAAVNCSADGKNVLVIGLGTDQKYWWAGSFDGGVTWAWVWGQVNNIGTFISEPSFCTSADGQTLVVTGIGTDNRCWVAQSSTRGANWNFAWTPIGNAVFSSGLSMCMSADGKKIIIVGKGSDNKFWFNSSLDSGFNWSEHWKPIGEGVFISGPSICSSWDMNIIHVFGVGNDNRMWRAYSIGLDINWKGWWQIPSNPIF